MIVATAITTARDEKVPIKVAITTDFPYTTATDIKIAKLQILKPEETKMIHPVDPSNRSKPPHRTRRCGHVHQRTNESRTTRR